MRVVLRGLARARATKLTFKSGYFKCECEFLHESKVSNQQVDALMRECVSAFQQASNLGLQAPPEVLDIVSTIQDPAELSDTIAHHLPSLSTATRQELLEEADVSARLEKLVHILMRELQVLELQTSLRSKVEEELGQTQREYYLREQMRAIQEELGGEEDFFSDEGESYKRKIEAAGMPQETSEKAMQELRRLERAPSSSPEGMVIRNYLDWLVDLPWQTVSEDTIDVKMAAKILDRDHYGLDNVKDRILDFLAVRQLSKSLRGPILCFVGPPGVGKTSIGRSIAESLGRKFHRMSLGGVRDEAEIRGHRRTYIGSMPGRLIQGIKQCGTKNPVFMLDEIDKMTSDLRGDPTSALLEALDPEQNAHFSDHYIESTFDLSNVMFITTANLLENVPPALRDRMEVIRFPSYTEHEKLKIAQKYLVPKQLAEHGLKKSQLSINKATLETIVREYTREAGVRWLQREIGTLCRKTARLIAEGETTGVKLDHTLVQQMLGKPKFRYGLKGKKDEIGAATGLVYSEYGGDIITIEANLSEPFGEQPQVKLTGSLGDVMKESARAALTYAKSHADELGISSSRLLRSDIHIHVPAGAIPKDGPSAGVTMAVALVSALSGVPVRHDVAMTGEVTISGRVLPIGGVKEKILGACRAGIRDIILPTENLADLEDLSDAERDRMTFHGASELGDVLRVALRTPDGVVALQFPQPEQEFVPTLN